MIRNFANKIAIDIWETSASKSLPPEFWIRAKALLTIMHATSDMNDLKIKGQPPNIRLHKLKGDRKGQWAITVNARWRICFTFADGDAFDVELVDYHKG